MGIVNNSRGIVSSVQVSTSVISGSDSFFGSCRSSEISASFGGSVYSIAKGSDRDSTLTVSGSRFLFPSFSCSQENRGNETGDRSFYSEHFSDCPPFQNGNKQVNQGFHSSGYVDYFPGSLRCLFPHPDFTSVQEVSPLCLERPGFPVQSPSFWAGYSPFSFYQGFTNSYGSPSFFGHSDSLLLGRFPTEGIQPRHSEFSYSDNYQSFASTRFPGFLEKVRAQSIPGFPFSRGTLQDRLRPSFPPCREVLTTLSEDSGPLLSGVSYCSSLSSTPGVNELFSRCSSSGSTSYSSPSVLSSQTLGSCISGLGSSGSNSTINFSTSAMVVSQGECSKGCDSLSSYSKSDTVHGCFSSRMGSFSRRSDSFRGLVSVSPEGSHQHSGDEGSSFSNQSLSGLIDSESCHVGHRQYHSGGLSQESGRYPLFFSVSTSLGHSDTVFSTSCAAISSSHSGKTQSVSRQSFQVFSSSQHRVGATPVSFSGHHTPMGLSSCRPVCYKSQQQTSNFCVSCPRSQVLSSGCNESIMGRNVRLRLSSFQVSKSCSTEDRSRELQDHSYCTSLAKTSVVSRSASSILCSASSSTSEIRSPLSVQRKSSAPKPRESSSSRLVAVRDSLRKRGFSSEAAKHISGSVRESTNLVYDARWTIFSNWCSEREIDPFQITVQHLADFLVFLFEVKGLSPSTIKGYRSAISRTLVLSGGPDFGSNEFISLLVRNFSLERPRQKVLVPQWDLGLVLASLKISPFEPAETVNIKFLSYKCCFLLALASGRRRSELHAFSVSDSCLRFNRDFSSVTLLTDPSFLAKNQIPDRGADPVIIPALPSECSSRLLCPVRILRIYLDRTRTIRTSNNSRLFIPIKKGISDLSVKTISTWICQTIFLAYKSSGNDLLNSFNIRAHDVRAVSSSWALFNSASLNDVLAAGFWRNENSFISHYLRSMATFADSLFSLGPIVSAQRVNFPPMSSDSGDSALR